MKRHQDGMVMVEIAIAGVVFFMLLFAVIEMGRLLFVWNALSEVTRRGARAAAVCPVDDPAILSLAVFGDGVGTISPVINGLSTQHVQVQYLDGAGAAGATGDNIDYVGVSIVGFQHRLLIPGLNITLTAPSFVTVRPREALGTLPDPDNPLVGGQACYSPQTP